MNFRCVSLIITSTFFLCSSCSEQSKKSESEKVSEIIDEPKVQEENVFRLYDDIEAKVTVWNNAISKNQPEKLSIVYTSQVSYYLLSKSSSECIAQKKSWLDKHPGYTQSIKNLEVYYFETEDLPEEFVAEFDKLCTENGKTTTVHSLLHFTKQNNDWLLSKETDDATELARAKKASVIKLPEGHYDFSRNYWSDTRSIPEFAHETVPYRTSINFDILEGVITGNVDMYSGTMRSSMTYLIVAGTMENGLLTFEVFYNPNEEYSLDDLEELETHNVEKWTFKIVDSKTLVGISKDDSFLLGKEVWKNN